jgi:hypothetical protein
MDVDALLAYLIVAAAAAYAAWVLMPRTLRRRLVVALRRVAPDGAQSWLAKMDAAETGCSTCKGCGTPAEAPGLKARELKRR